MRALVLTNLYPPHHYGGYELLCRDTVEGWRARGHTVKVVCSDHRIAGRPDGDPDVERTMRFYWRDHEVLRPPARARFAIERSNHRRWTRVIDEFQPDVVSVWNFGLFGYPVLAEVIDRGVPLVLVIGDLWPCWGPAFDPWTSTFANASRVRRSLGRVIERVTGIATTLPDLGAHAVALPASEWLRTRIERDSPFTFRQMAVVPHGFDTGDFPIVDAAAIVDRPFGWHLLLPGRIDDRKGWRTAVRALAHLPEASLTLAGGGDAREVAAVCDVAAEVGAADRVVHIVVEREDMAAQYRAADAVLFPSEWDEPFGIVGLEAMACGIPVVATGTGGSGEYLEHDVNCLLFPPGDAVALASAVQRLAGDPPLRQRLRLAGRETASRFTEDTTVGALERWHLAAIGS